MPNQSPTKTRRTAGLRCTAVLMLLLLPGCSGTRGGTPARAVAHDISGCAATLPLARASVVGPSVLVKVHTISRAAAMRFLQTVGGVPAPQKDLRGHLCVIAYRGAYRRAQVPLARTAEGQYAVLLITVRHPRVIAAALVNTLPGGV